LPGRREPTPTAARPHLRGVPGGFAATARTITEGDIVTFAGVSGDFNSIHTDEVYATQSGFGRRVAHGLLGLSIVSGLAVRTGILEGTVLAFREINEWKFSLPVYIGDTVYADLEVDEVKPFPRLGGGLVGLSFDVKNQSDKSDKVADRLVGVPAEERTPSSTSFRGLLCGPKIPDRVRPQSPCRTKF
jgi:acyl dehydratase